MQNQIQDTPKTPNKSSDHKGTTNTPPLESDFDTPHDIKPPKAQMAGRAHTDEDESDMDVNPREPAVREPKSTDSTESCGTGCGCGTGKKPN